MQTVITVPNKGKFGWKYPNGTLSGALGNLQKRKSDIALTAFFMKVIIPKKEVFGSEKYFIFSHYDFMRCICLGEKCYCDIFWQEMSEVL